MRFNLSAIAVRERAVTLFFILLLAAAGAYAFFMLGRAEDPNFTIKTLTVTTAWPGATAREMQDLVAEPLEKRLQELTWYDRVETSTRPGYAYMTLTLKDSTPPSAVQEEFYQARKKLGDEARNLPPGVLGPFVNDEYSDVSFALYALKAKGMPMRELARQAEVIRQDLLHVPGVKKINILGERPEQIFVDFSYAKLATLGISARDIVAALQRQNTVTPAGSIDTRGPRVFIRVNGAYNSVQAIADTPIVAAGRTLKLSDIANVSRGYEDPPTYLIRHQGEPTIMLADLVVGLNIDAAQVLKHLRGRHPLFARITFVGTIEGATPALGFEHREAILESFPLLGLRDGQGFGRVIGKEQRVGHLLAALLRQDLLDLVVGPSEGLDDRVNKILFGLGLVGLGDLEKLAGNRLEPVAEVTHRFVGEGLPLSGAIDAIQQVIASEEISRNHESNPDKFLMFVTQSTKISGLRGQMMESGRDAWYRRLKPAETVASKSWLTIDTR
jgi:AcrB/AcrD/AcrF family